MRSKKIRLKPTKEQEIIFKRSAGAMRFAYNWALNKQKENYNANKPYIKVSDLRKQFTVLRNTKGFEWLKDVSNDIPKQAIKDADTSFKRFFKGVSNYPRYKRKHKTILSFYNDQYKLKVEGKNIRLAKIGWVKTSEYCKVNEEYYNARVVFDGKYWYLTMKYQEQSQRETLTEERLGIDLGIKYLAVCSNGMKVENINKSYRVKKLEKRLRRLQRKVSKKYDANMHKQEFVKTSNIKKTEREIRLIHRRIKNIRQNYIHQTTSAIVKTKPKCVVVENLNILGMMKNRHLAKAIVNQKFNEFQRQLKYKCEGFGIEYIVAESYYPSTQTCSRCSKIKRNEDKLNLQQRIFKCECGLQIDRDFNASINLSQYEIA